MSTSKFFSKKGIAQSILLCTSTLIYIPAFLGLFQGGVPQQQIMLLISLVVLLLCIVTLVNTDFGLSVLVFSMLLSPELELFHVPQRAVAIRFDDFLIGTVFVTWMAKMALFKEVVLLRTSPLNRPMILYILACIISTLIGFQTGTVRGLAPFFFVLKYFEYFLIFFMFVNNIQTKEQVQRFLGYFLFTGLIVCLFALSLYGRLPRLTAPFEGESPEPASLGGYLLVLISFSLGLVSYPGWPRRRPIAWVFLCLFIVTLLLSSSRGAFVGFLPLYVVAVLLSSQGRNRLIIFLVIGVVLGILFIPPSVVEFMEEAFAGKAYEVGGYRIQLGPTGVIRVNQWKSIFQEWMKRPILGYGVTGVGLVDSQHVRVLGETGLIGICIFFWLLTMVFWVGFVALKRGSDHLTKALGMALICANVGLITQGITANSYIIVRIMEPFWFLAAMTTGTIKLSERT